MRALDEILIKTWIDFVIDIVFSIFFIYNIKSTINTKYKLAKTNKINNRLVITWYEFFFFYFLLFLNEFLRLKFQFNSTCH